MAIQTPLVLISGAFSSLPPGDTIPASDPVAQASGNAALVLANTALASGNAGISTGLTALASGNAGISTGLTALASGNAALVLAGTALASGNAGISTGLTALASGNAGLVSASNKVPILGGTMMGVLAVTSGTAALPAVTPSGNPNTGLFFPGADQLALSTGGVGRLFVDQSGRITVGASTTAVGITLEVVCNAVALAIGIRGRSSDNISIIGFYPNASGTEYARIQSNADSSLAIGTGSSGTERARIDSSGRLLVGTIANANGGILQLSSGITFPATAVAATDVNTLDDYEEGTWTPNQGVGLTVVGAFSSSGTYTKIGRQITITGTVAGATSVAIVAGGIICTNCPFAGSGNYAGSIFNAETGLTGSQVWQQTSAVYAIAAAAAATSHVFTVTYFV